MKEYNTRQHERILSFFRDNPEKGFSAREASRMLPGIAQATVYRLIPRLMREGYLMKVPGPGHEASFQYRDPGSCSRHLHIRCSRCGRVWHIDDSISASISDEIDGACGFQLLSTSVLEGICPMCRRERE